MKLFEEKTQPKERVEVENFITKHRDKLLQTWIATPQIFFNRITTPTELIVVFDRVEEARPKLRRFILEAFEYITTWQFSEEDFSSLLGWFPNKTPLLEVIAKKPEWLSQQIKKTSTLSLFVDVIFENSPQQDLIDTFLSILFLQLTHTELQAAKKLVLQASKPALSKWVAKCAHADPNCFQDSEWMAIWPSLVSRVDQEFLFDLLTQSVDLSAWQKDKLDWVFEPVLKTHPEIVFNLLDFFQLNKKENLRDFLSTAFINSLLLMESKLENVQDFFERFYLKSGRELPNFPVEHYLHFMKIFPELYTAIAEQFFAEKQLIQFKLEPSPLAKLVVQLPESVRGQFLLDMLQALARHKKPLFTPEQTAIFVGFCCQQVSADDAELAFYLGEYHWESYLKWNDISREQLIKRCSVRACSRCAVLQDQQGLSRFVHLFITQQSELLSAMINNMTSKAMAQCLKTEENKKAFSAFASKEVGREFISRLVEKLEKSPFILFAVQFSKKYILEGKVPTMTSRFVSAILDSTVALNQHPEFVTYLRDWCEQIFDYFMDKPEQGLCFLHRLEHEPAFAELFKVKLTTVDIAKQKTRLGLQLEFENVDLTVGKLVLLLDVWHKSMADAPKNSIFKSTEPVPRFIQHLKSMIKVFREKKQSRNDIVDSQQRTVLNLLLRLWLKERNEYSPATTAVVDSLTGLLSSTRQLSIRRKIAAKSDAKEPVDRLMCLREIMSELEKSPHKTSLSFDDYKKPIEALIYVTEKINELLLFFQNYYGQLYYIPRLKIPVHTDHAERNDVNGFRKAMLNFIDNFNQAYLLAKTNNKLAEFFGLLPNGNCLEGRVGPIIDWANVQSENEQTVVLDKFMELNYHEWLVFSAVVKGGAAPSNPEDFAHYVIEHYGVRLCHPHEAAPHNRVDKEVIYRYAQEIFLLQPPIQKTGILSFFTTNKMAV